MLWLNALVVLSGGGIGAAHVLAHWWRERWSQESRIAAVGGLVFMGVARKMQQSILPCDLPAVAGLGVAAALVASMVTVAFAAEAERLDNPALALAHINRTLCGSLQGAYVTAWCGVIDAINRRLIYSNAGHPAPLLRRTDGRVEALVERGLPLSFDSDARYPTGEVALHPGDRLVFFSDGLIEACDARDEFLGDARLEQPVASGRAVTADPAVCG